MDTEALKTHLKYFLSIKFIPLGCARMAMGFWGISPRGSLFDTFSLRLVGYTFVVYSQFHFYYIVASHPGVKVASRYTAIVSTYVT